MPSGGGPIGTGGGGRWVVNGTKVWLNVCGRMMEALRDRVLVLLGDSFDCDELERECEGVMAGDETSSVGEIEWTSGSSCLDTMDGGVGGGGADGIRLGSSAGGTGVCATMQ